MKFILIILLVFILSLYFHSLTPCSRLEKALGCPLHPNSGKCSYYEIDRNNEFVDLFEAVAKISLDYKSTEEQLAKCGFTKAKPLVFPTNLDRVSWWPKKTSSGKVYFKDNGDNGYCAAMWERGILYFYISKH
jgi:hypothetical protein